MIDAYTMSVFMFGCFVGSLFGAGTIVLAFYRIHVQGKRRPTC